MAKCLPKWYSFPHALYHCRSLPLQLNTTPTSLTPASTWLKLKLSQEEMLNQCLNCITCETYGMLSPESALSFSSFHLLLWDKGKCRNTNSRVSTPPKRWQHCHNSANTVLQQMRETWIHCGKVGCIKAWLSESQMHRSRDCLYLLHWQPLQISSFFLSFQII